VYLAKMNNLPKHHGAGPQRRGATEARGPMQLHRLHRLKAGPGWDGQKNEVITFSRYAKIHTAGSTSSGELQTALSIGFQKQKRQL